jgi:hypothetical protein
MVFVPAGKFIVEAQATHVIVASQPARVVAALEVKTKVRLPVDEVIAPDKLLLPEYVPILGARVFAPS